MVSDSQHNADIRIESGYVSLVELERRPGAIEAVLYNRLLDIAKHRFCLVVTYDGKDVKVSSYIVLRDTYLYRLEDKKLDVIS